MINITIHNKFYRVFFSCFFNKMFSWDTIGISNNSHIISLISLKSFFKFCFNLFISWFSKKSKHIFLVCFNSWLIKWIYT